MRGLSGLCLLSLLSAAPGAAAPVFQYDVPVAADRGEHRAFLWIPPRAAQVRGAVLGGMTLMEREFVKDPHIRAACAAEQLALVFLTCGLGGADLQKVLDDLAAASGYRELSVAPLMFVGHSAGGPPAKACATREAARCFGLVQYRGGGPGGADPLPPGVPALVMIGQFDEFGGTMRREDGRECWERSRDDMAAFRARNETNLGSLVVEPGAGHFAWSDRNAAYLALFIRKAAQARIPAAWPLDAPAPVALNAVDPRGGWLTDLAIRAPGAAPAAWNNYTGDRAATAWHADRELAEATAAYHAGGFAGKDQFIRWNDPYWVDAGTRYFFTALKWVDDGQTFEVHPAYADAYPAPQPNGAGPRWLQAGEAVGHSAAPILVKQVSGPVAAAGPDRLRMCYDALAPATGGARVTFMAFSAGDADYRYTEHVGMMPRGFAGLKGGKPQAIAFPPVGNLKADGTPVELKATSDAGLPVEYYVARGPAVVKDGRLAAAEVPARAVLPMTVTVVAWQFGRGVEPLVQTAAPVAQTVAVEP